MELDEFKLRLKEQAPAEKTLHTADELEGYIRKKTSSIIDSIKHRIVFELLACCILIAAAVWAWFGYTVPYIRAFSLLSFMLSCFLLIYLVAVYNKINIYEKGGWPVKKSLQQVITILSAFTRVYFQFTMITLPIAFIFGIITGFLHAHQDTAIKNFNWQRAFLFYTVWFVVWSVIMYFFSKWYIKKLYGNRLLQLKDHLKDIENG
jgi:hypothetical protein